MSLELQFLRLQRKFFVYCSLDTDYFSTVITLRDNKITANKYAEGRKLYLDLWGVDPWGKGFCWDYKLFSKLECNNKNATNNTIVVNI